jgi:hypothetical protein
MKTEKALKWLFKGVKALALMAFFIIAASNSCLLNQWIALIMVLLLLFVYTLQLSKTLNK